jgi:hypothetical protein
VTYLYPIHDIPKLRNILIVGRRLEAGLSDCSSKRRAANQQQRYPFTKSQLVLLKGRTEARRRARASQAFPINPVGGQLGTIALMPTIRCGCIDVAQGGSSWKSSSTPSTSWRSTVTTCGAKTNLARLLARRPDGILVAPFEQGEIGADLFRGACDMSLEGLVSKRRDRPYQGGRSKRWVKVKNRKHPAMERVMEAFS